MKKWIALLLAAVMAAVWIPSGYAAQGSGVREYIVGDADGDGSVTVVDATRIQRFLAELIGMDELYLPASDTDGDGEVGILDATAIQRWLVGFDAGKNIGEIASITDDEALRREIEEQIKIYTPQKGLDISVHNGDVDMEKVKAAGFTFVIIRLGYGDDMACQDDVWFERNVKKAEAAGLDWGAYIYSYALTLDEAKSEVAHTLRLLRGKHPTMPIAFDMEDADGYKSRCGMPSNQTLQQICITYLSGIEAAGYYPILYANLNWLTNKLDYDMLLDNYDIWAAQWNTELQYHRDNVTMWQYGGEVNYIDSPYIDGLSGTFDKNICYKNYPVIIKAYGYNNHEALITEDAIAPTALTADSDYVPKAVPAGYDGAMGRLSDK